MSLVEINTIDGDLAGLILVVSHLHVCLADVRQFMGSVALLAVVNRETLVGPALNLIHFLFGPVLDGFKIYRWSVN